MIHSKYGGQVGPPLVCVFLLASLLCPGKVFAQQSHPETKSQDEVRKLSPDEAVDLAIKNNLSLESGRVSLDTKKRKSDLVWNQFVPQVDVNGTLMRDNWATTTQGGMIVAPLGTPGYSLDHPTFGQGTVYTNPDIFLRVVPPSTLPNWRVNGGFTVSYNFSFALIEGIKSIRLDYEAGLVTMEKARTQLERDVRKAYYQMLLLGEQIDLLRGTYQSAERRAAMAEANYRAGRAPELTWLQARVAMENLKPTMDQAENGLKMAYAQFAMNLGLPYNIRFELVPVETSPANIPLDLQEMISRAASGKPDILELQKSIQTLQSQRKAQAIQLYTPNLRLSWGMSSTFIRDPWKDSWFEGDNWNKGGNFSLTLGMSLNSLFSFTKEGQGLKDIDNSMRNLEIGLARTIVGTEIEIYNTVLSLEKIRTTIEAQNLTIELAERTYQLTETAYRAGLSDLLEVQNTELELRRARNGVAEQNYNYLMGLADLEYAIGAPFGSLMGRN